MSGRLTTLPFVLIVLMVYFILLLVLSNNLCLVFVSISSNLTLATNSQVTVKYTPTITLSSLIAKYHGYITGTHWAIFHVGLSNSQETINFYNPSAYNLTTTHPLISNILHIGIA